MPTADPSSVLVAHRGDTAAAPENTIPAVQAALVAGARFVEFDVQLTADEVPVVIHDERLARTAGVDRSVHDLTADELASIGVRMPGSPASDGVAIPTLDAMIGVIRLAPTVTAFVEIKRSSLRRFGRTVVVDRVSPPLAAAPTQVVVISYDAGAIRETRERLGRRIGWVIERWDDTSRVEAERLAPDFLFADRRTLRADDTPLWAGAWTWVVFDVDDPADARRLSQRGVTLFETRTFAATAAAFREAGP